MKINLNSDDPQIVISILLRAVKRFEDTPINRQIAINEAKTIWDVRSKTVEVVRWKSGVGQTLFKRTNGHRIG